MSNRSVMDRVKWLRVLWHVRIFGPCRRRELRERTGLGRHDVNAIVLALLEENLVEEQAANLFDVTHAGRAMLEHLSEMQGVARHRRLAVDRPLLGFDPAVDAFFRKGRR